MSELTPDATPSGNGTGRTSPLKTSAQLSFSSACPNGLPPKLPPMGTIGIVSPSGSFEADRLQPALAYLRARGFRIYEGPSLYAHNRYLAGTDEERAHDINTMFADPDVHAIFVARGGYGSARILEHLNWEAIAQNPKPLTKISPLTKNLTVFGDLGRPRNPLNIKSLALDRPKPLNP